MTRYAMLNNIAHKDLRVITHHNAKYGDNVGLVPTVPTEFADVQREYPIFFRKNRETGEYESVALLGFDKDENLFLEGERWVANYIPGFAARGPFLIGFQEQQVEGERRREPVIHVNLDDPRISHTEGEPLFLPQGGNSPYLERIAMILRGIHHGLEISRAMFASFDAAGLIRPLNVEVKLNTEEGVNLTGLHGIDEEKLANLDGEALLKLHRSGFLQAAFLVISSMGNVPRLISLRQRRRRQPASASHSA